MIVQFTILHKKITVVNRFSRIDNFFLHFFENSIRSRKRGPIFLKKIHTGTLVEICRWRRHRRLRFVRTKRMNPFPCPIREPFDCDVASYGA